MKRKLGICTHSLRGLSELDALPLIKEAGFDCTFIAAWQSEPVKALKEKADALGLALEFIHAPFDRINEMWLPGDGYLHIYDKMIQTIDSAAENGIPMVVSHLSSGWQAPAISDVGLARYDALVAHAKEKGVIVAFENLRVVGNLAYFTDRYESEPAVQFCYDCGHEHCYTKTVCWPDIFTTRIGCTHIHDNMSRELGDKTCDPDTHLMPFDGTFDYAKMMRKLDEYGYTGSLMLELFQHQPEYQNLDPKEYLQICYERIKRISEM